MDDNKRRDDGMAQRRKVLGHEWVDKSIANRNADEFRLHVRAALAEGGFTPDDIKEIILQQAIYCGVPAANHAVKEASAIVAELGLLKG